MNLAQVFKSISALVFCVASTALAPAATIYPVTGTIGLSVLTQASDGTEFAFDLRGAELFGVADNSGTTLGGIVLSDGTIFGLPAPAAPNSLLLASNLTGTQAALLTFSNYRTGGTGVLLDATVQTPFSTTDPALQLFTSLSPLTFDFTLQSQAPFGGGLNLSLLTLNSITSSQSLASVPEPVYTLILPLVFLAGRRRIRHARRPSTAQAQ